MPTSCARSSAPTLSAIVRAARSSSAWSSSRSGSSTSSRTASASREREPAACRRAGGPTPATSSACSGRVGGRWVRGQLLLGVSIFLATVIGLPILTLIGFSEFGQFTLLLALIAGILEWLPIIGPIVAAVPAILIGLSSVRRPRSPPPCCTPPSSSSRTTSSCRR